MQEDSKNCHKKTSSKSRPSLPTLHFPFFLQYIARLKTELSEAEAALAESIKKEEAEEPQKSFIEVHVDNVPESPKQENIVL